MGATQTTFCNDSAIPISTGLSVWVTYYFTETLLPQQCVTYNVGRVWFTAFAHLSSGYDPVFGWNEIYFLTNKTTAVGMYTNDDPEVAPLYPSKVKYLRVTRDEVEYIMAESEGFVPDNLDKVRDAINAAWETVYATWMGYYAGSNHTIRVTGGPKRTLPRIDRDKMPVHILPFKQKFDPFQIHIDS